MPRVICTLPNASLLINGITFYVLEDKSGVISDEIDQETADNLASIPGYFLEAVSEEDHTEKTKVEPPVTPKAQKGPTAAEKRAAAAAAEKAKADEEAAAEEARKQEEAAAAAAAAAKGGEADEDDQENSESQNDSGTDDEVF